MNIMNCNLTPDKCPFCIDNICTMECVTAFDYIDTKMPEPEDFNMESRTT